MKKYLIAAATLFIAATSSIVAQNLASGYFVEDYTYRFQMNPAMGNSKNFVSMPALGNLNVGVNGTLSLKHLIFNRNGQTTTFMSPYVSADEVLNGLHNKNRIESALRLNILSFGFKGMGGYNTVAIGARTEFGFQLPKSIFSLLKQGVSNSAYSIKDLGAFANAYAEISLGHSRQITNELRVGANLKFLVGGGNVDIRMNEANLILGENDWSIESNAEISARVKGLRYETEVNEHTNHKYVNGVKVDGGGPNGFGMAVDLGATYTPAVLPDLTVSLALLDFGFINWSENVVASTKGSKFFNTDRYIFSVDDDSENSFKNVGDRIRDDISALYELEDLGNTGSKATMLGATMNVGAEYALPYYRKLKFGLLNTTRFQGAYTWTDFRLSANVAPVKCFDASVNVAAGTFGCSFGWLANLHAPGFNLFIGMDHTLGKVTKQFVPLSSNASVNFGINFLF